MSAIAFDTLAYAKKLKAVGFSEDQAEVQAEEIAKLVEERLATKRDLHELEVALKRDIKELELRMKQNIEHLKHDLTLRLGGMMVTGIAVVATLVKLL